MARTPLVAANWKMNTTVPEAVALAAAVWPGLVRVAGVECLLCPPFVSLTAVRDQLTGSPVRLGAQNMYFEPKGAYTGERAKSAP
jgi:triosephosphate isomerase